MRLLSWPDMLVLTGLTNGFDRMLHLTAYARSKNLEGNCRRRRSARSGTPVTLQESF